jgi:DNA-binding transcriptional LysR family regulator
MGPANSIFTIDIRRLWVLRELRQKGTVGATAQALNITPSGVSQQIAALGRELGVPLLAPQGRGVRLTPQAQLLLEHAAVISHQLESARAELAAFAQGTAGQVGIGGFASAITALVAPALIRLRQERPRLELRVQEIQAPECFTRLDAGDLDLVIAVDYHGGPTHGDIRFHRCDLLDDPLLAALPAGHPLAAQPVVALQDLAGESWVAGAMHGPCHEVALAACTAAGFNPNLRHAIDDWAVVLTLVAAHCGVALVPRLGVPTGDHPGVVIRPLGGPQRPSRHIYAAVRAGSEANPTLAPVLAALCQAAQALGGASQENDRAMPGSVQLPRRGPGQRGPRKKVVPPDHG